MLKPLIELLIADAFWGFGFVATVWVLKDLGAPAIIFYRFLIAFVVGGLLLLLRKQKEFKWVEELKIAFWPGVFLAATLNLQTWGLKTVPAGEAAFITTLYVVIVPLLSAAVTRIACAWTHYIYVGIALVGTAMMADVDLQGWGIGETVTLANAFAAALHILFVDIAGRKTKNTFALSVFQSFWTMLLSLPLYGLDPRFSLAGMSGQAWAGLASLAIGSSLLGFYFQFRAQQRVSPSTASLLFLLESPFTIFFAWWLLAERYSTLQIAGAVIIILACAGSIRAPHPKPVAL